MRKENDFFDIKPGTVLSFGVTRVLDGVQFGVRCPISKKCFLKLYLIGRKAPSYIIELTDEYRQGGGCFVKLCIKNAAFNSVKELVDTLSQKYEYTYELDGIEITDTYAQIVHGRNQWGRRPTVERAGICLEEFDWENDKPIRRKFNEVILYQLHVRGYTRHSSSGVKNKGTFDGLISKIPYMKELGVNAVMLLPCYEFDEIQKEQHFFDKYLDLEEEKQKTRLNYWGYGAKDTYYMAPKASYASNAANAVLEYKLLIKAFHQAGIEVLMDIYFLPRTNVCLMTDCLRSWVINYHIDGFRVNQEVMPSIILASDAVLSGTKILTSYWDINYLSNAGVDVEENALAEYNEGFMNDARRFLKSDEGMVETFAGRMRRNPPDYAVINFVTHVNGFTLKDLVSYDVKHNETNGEQNRDGTEYNYSWNCGIEGKTRKKLIIQRRTTQMRNAFMMLMCSQGTPMILAGDEFGNTQYGNNNPYCHDDNVTWLNWNHAKADLDMLDFVKKLINFRKSHPVLHQSGELTMMDYKCMGTPDISIHGTHIWKTDFSNYSRMLAVFLCGKYAKNEGGLEDDSIYIIYNMYWEEKEFDLPNLPIGMEWYLAVDTENGIFEEIHKPSVKHKKIKDKKQKIKKVMVSPRTIAVYVGRKK